MSITLFRQYCVLMAFLCLSIISSAQDSKLFSQVIPPAPNAAALGKFADLPVGTYNGIPQINVPIYTIKVNDIAVPISLDYHAGGIKVVEIPSLVGLGWALNAGGVITRTVRGNPDEANNGFVNGLPNTYGSIPSGSQCLSGTDAATFNYETAVTRNNDTEPDMFYFNVCGMSGKFVIDQNRVIHTIPYSKIKIEPQDLNFLSWKITGEDGIQYIFNTYEESLTTQSTTTYKSTWYLTEIKSPTSTRGVTFEYQTENFNYALPLSESLFTIINQAATHQCPPYEQLYPYQKINANMIINGAKRLSKITFPNGKVEFISGNYRYDLKGATTLGQIKISSTEKPLKKFNLAYNYFTNSTVNWEDDGFATASTEAVTTRRLCLKSVQEESDSVATNPPYLFSYYTPSNVTGTPFLPDRVTSNAQDHWGYYNGQTDNTTLIPTFVDAINIVHNGAVRQAYEEYAKAGTLNIIQYPTGGQVKLEYEQNDAESDLLPNNIVGFKSTYSLGSCHVTNSGSFVINNQSATSTTVNLKLSGGPWPLSGLTCTGGYTVPTASNPNSYIYFQIIDITNATSPQVVYLSSGSLTLGSATGDATTTVSLPNGTYRIKAIKGNSNFTISAPELNDGHGNFYGLFEFSASGYFEQLGTKKVGGLRVKKITHYDPVTSKSFVKTYLYKDSTLSSGKVSYVPSYHYPLTERGACSVGEGANKVTYIETTDFDVATSSSNAPLTQMQGSFVGYSKVTVIDGEETLGSSATTNGKTEFLYSNPIDYQPYQNNPQNNSVCFVNTFIQGVSQFPFAPSIELDWQRGLLEKQSVFKKNGTGYSKVKEIINTYKTDYWGADNYYNGTTDQRAAKIGIAFKTYGEVAPYYQYKTQYYFIPSRFSKLTKTDEYDYTEGGPAIVSSTEYSYDNPDHLQLSRSILHLSDGSTNTTQNLYPLDFTNTTGFIGDMKTANIIAKPIETIAYRTVGSTITILSGSLLNYKPSTKVGLIDKFWKLETTVPIALNQFKFANQSVAGVLPNSGTPATYAADSHYPIVANNSFDFDSYGNIITKREASGISTSYRWLYNSQYPIVQIANAEATEFYYEGFEESTAIGVISGLGHTGTKYSTNTAIAWTRPNARSYVISYWYRSGGAWKYSLPQPYLTNSYTLLGGDAYDDVRVYPVDAQMTTYTYKPIAGMTSSTDAKGLTTYYDYDGFQRLQNIKDYQGNIVKSFDYNYRPQ